MSARFSNPWPHAQHRFLDIVRWKLGKNLNEPVWNGVASDDPAPWQSLPKEAIANPPTEGWRVSWLGHASFLVQGAGLNFLIDPVFSDYCAPLPLRGLKRLIEVPIGLDDLPKIDFILLTHGHYDHLDLPTLRKLGSDLPIVIADGHKGWLGRRGFQQVREVPWWDTFEIVPGVKITATPAQHFTARTPWDRNRGHWCGWIIEGAGVRLWHAGDSAWCPAFEEIGRRFSPIDLGMIPIGAYNPRAIMESVHVTPEEAVEVFKATGCKHAVAMHWGTFRLTDEPMSEPPARLKEACDKAAITSFKVLPVGGCVTVGG